MHDNNNNDHVNSNLEVDMAKSDRLRIISGLPTLHNKLKIIAAYSDIHLYNNNIG